MIFNISLPKITLTKSLAFLCVFILLTVAILGTHGSALAIDDFSKSFSDKTQNIGGDIEEYREENNSSSLFVWEYVEDGNSTINISFVDEKDANDDTNFDYTFESSCTDPDNSDTDGDGISDWDECEKRNDNPSQYNPNIQDSLPPTVSNVKISMDEHWTSITVTIIPSVTILGVTTPAVTASVSIIDGISIRVTADIWDASGVYDVTFTKESTVVDGLLVSGNTFNAGFWLGINLGSLIKLVTDITVGFTVKVKAYDYLNNWNESEGSYDGPFTTLAKIAVTILDAAWNALCTVGEAIVEALESLVSWIWDVIEGMINAVVQPIVDAIENWVRGIANTLKEEFSEFIGHSKPFNAASAASALWAQLALPVTVIAILLTVFECIEILITPFVGGGTVALGSVAEFIKPIILSALVGLSIIGMVPLLGEVISGEESEDGILSVFKDVAIVGGLATAIYSFITSFWALIKVQTAIAKRAAGVGFALIGLIITVWSPTVSTGMWLLALDTLGLISAVGGFALMVLSYSDVKDQITGGLAKLVVTLEWMLGTAGIIGSVLAVLAHISTGGYNE